MPHPSIVYNLQQLCNNGQELCNNAQQTLQQRATIRNKLKAPQILQPNLVRVTGPNAIIEPNLNLPPRRNIARQAENQASKILN